MKQYLILELETTKPIPDLADKVAGRAYTLDGVEDAQVKATWTENGPIEAPKVPEPVQNVWLWRVG